MNTDRLIFLSYSNPGDITKWSGITHSIFDAIVKNSADNSLNIKITYVGRALRLLNLGARLVNKIFLLFGIPIDIRYSTPYAMIAGGYLTIRLLFIGEGAVLAIAASSYLAYIITKRKIIYVSDATFSGICDLYPRFNSFPKWLKTQGHRNEMKTLTRSQFSIFPSQWASESARSVYKVPTEKIYQLPFGPCIPEKLINEYYLSKPADLSQEIVVIHVSVDWKRKNGDKAIDVCRLLIAAGIQTRLILVGNIPEHARHINFVDYRGFLRKSDPAQLAELCRAYRESHFLLVPTAAEAFGIVFSEAQAFGVPPVAHDVGGTGSAIVADDTGLLLPLGAPPEVFAEKIIRYINDPKLYGDLSQRCRKHYLQRANWRRWSALIFQLSR